MIRRVAILFLIAAAACTHTSTLTNLPAPNPNGCYVRVYDRTDFGGIGDVFNGPGRWPRLERLVNTNEESWRNRIRSLHVGTAATLTVYVEQDFKGSSRQFPPAADQPRLDPELSGRIESLEISCAPTGASSDAVRVFSTGRGLRYAHWVDQAPPSKPDAAVVTMPMEFFAGRPAIRVGLNGKGPFAFLLSPEARTTLIDRALATELNIEPRKTAAGTSQINVSLELGSTKLGDVPAALTDMAQFVPEFGPDTRPRGVISLSIWKNQVVTIDYPQWRATVAPGPLPPANGRDVFDLSPSRELTLPMSLGDRSVSCRVDPLFSGGILLPAAYVKSLPVVGRVLRVGPIATPHGMFEVQEAQLAVSISVGSFEFPNPVVRFADSLPMAMAGRQWLAGLAVSYDIANGRVRLERQRGVPKLDAS